MTRYRNIIIITLVVVSILLISGCTTQQKNTIKVSGAFALYPMMSKWADEYMRLHPDIQIDVQSGGAGKGMTDALRGIVDIGMVSREIHDSEIEQGAFWVSVVKDAVVATINSQNPVVDIILSRGVTKEEFKRIFIDRSVTTWGELVGDANITDPIRVYTRSDSCGAAETWALYLGSYTQDDLTHSADSAVNGDANLASAIQGDILGIGYNNINYVYDPATRLPHNGLQPVPIDLNEDGLLSDDESFYQERDSIVNAIANNIYPSPPSRALHLVTKGEFKGIVKDFVKWILTDGQVFVSDCGYIKLSDEMIMHELEYLENGRRL
ncbi:MAG: PstS family phosphate ABC transporter substrate-binding protein [Candidatus Thermoplasmatota archaeon]